MSGWQNALDNYQNGINSIAQDNLQSLEGGSEAKIQDVQAQVGVAVGKATGQGMSLLGHDSQAANLAQGMLTTSALGGPVLYKGATNFMNYRAGGMRSRAAAMREQNPDPEIQRQSDLQDRFDNLSEDQQAGVKSTLEADDTGTYGADTNSASLKASNDMAERAISTGEGGAPGVSADPEIQRQSDLQGRYNNLPEEQQAGVKSTLEADGTGTYGDDTNSASLKASNDMSERAISAGEAEVPGGANPTANPAAGAAADAADAAETAATDAADAAGTAATTAAEGLESSAGAMEGVADFLGAAAPWLGGIGAIAGLGTTIWETVKAARDSGNNPYAKIQGQVDAANAQTAQLTANISSDQFASKIGAQAPRYGSLAVPQMNTATQSGVALHV